MRENIENQRFAIYKWASQNGQQVLGEYEDIGVSGALPPHERPGFKKALAALDEADGLVVYALDHLARSLSELVHVVNDLEAKGEPVLSVRESWLGSLPDPAALALTLLRG